MLLFVLFAVLLIAGILILHSYLNSYRDFWDRDVWYPIGAVGCVLGLTGLLVCGGLCTSAQIGKDVKYQEALYEKEVLEYRLENRGDNLVGNEMLYSEIVDFNNDLRAAKRWADSPWVGCCFNEKLATIDYIEYKVVPNL